MVRPKSQPPELWERGLTRLRAAAYYGISPTSFDKLGFKPKHLIRSIYRYDKHDLDRWLDGRPRKDGSVPIPDNDHDDPDNWGDPEP